jgi:hypothetical protein
MFVVIIKSFRRGVAESKRFIINLDYVDIE